VGKALVKALKQDKDSSVRQSAAQALSAFGTRAVDELC